MYYFGKLPATLFPLISPYRGKEYFYTLKCSCCSIDPKYECNNHLFLQSEIAQRVWLFYANLMQITATGMTLNHQLTIWWQYIKGNTLFSWFLHILPCLLFGENENQEISADLMKRVCLQSPIYRKIKHKVTDIYL